MVVPFFFNFLKLFSFTSEIEAFVSTPIDKGTLTLITNYVRKVYSK